MTAKLKKISYFGDYKCRDGTRYEIVDIRAKSEVYGDVIIGSRFQENTDYYDLVIHDIYGRSLHAENKSTKHPLDLVPISNEESRISELEIYLDRVTEESHPWIGDARPSTNGWYPVPSGSGGRDALRYWDGKGWSKNILYNSDKRFIKQQKTRKAEYTVVSWCKPWWPEHITF